jgi:hypothetical protein
MDPWVGAQLAIRWAIKPIAPRRSASTDSRFGGLPDLPFLNESLGSSCAEPPWCIMFPSELSFSPRPAILAWAWKTMQR